MPGEVHGSQIRNADRSLEALWFWGIARIKPGPVTLYLAVILADLPRLSPHLC